MLKSLTIIGLIATVVGSVLWYYVHLYWSIAVILGLPMILLGLILRVDSKNKLRIGPETVYCNNCGSVLTKGTVFCPYCGKKL